jgi:hypothetical protein
MLAGVIATTGTAGLGLEPDLLAEWGRWPATAMLGAIAASCVYLLYRQGLAFASAQKDMAASINGLVRELSERPCVRKPTNN